MNRLSLRWAGTFPYAYDGGERSGTLGNVQRLPGGNTLVTYSNAGALHEVDASENPVLVIQTDNLGYSSWRDSMYGPPSDVMQ